VTSSVANDDVIKGGETDDWDGEDDFAETTNILSSRQQQQLQQPQTYLDYPAGMVRFMSLFIFNGLNKCLENLVTFKKTYLAPVIKSRVRDPNEDSSKARTLG